MKNLAGVIKLLVLTALYYLGARIGLYLEVQYSGVTPIWIPSGFAVALFLTKGLKFWPMVILGELFIALTLHQSYVAGVVGGLAQTFEAVLAVQLLRIKGARRVTDSVRSVLWFSALGALVPPILAATIGASTLRLLGYLEPTNYVSGLLTWWLGDAIGILVVTPILVGLRKWPFKQKAAALHFTIYTAIFIVVCLSIIIFGDHLCYYLFFVLIPFVVVSAIHFRLVGAGSASIILSILVFGMRQEDLNNGEFITAIRMAFVGTSAFTGYLVTGFMEKRQIRLDTIRRQNMYMVTLHDISLHLLDHLRIDQLMEAMVARACDLVNTSHGYFYRWDGVSEEIEVKAGKGIHATNSGYKVKTGDGVAGKVWQTGQPMCINDYQNWEERHPDTIWDEVSAIIGVPIMGKSRTVGVLGVLDTEEHRRFTIDDLRIMKRFAELASIALQNAEVHTQLKKTESNQRQLLTAIEFAVDEIMITDLEGTIQYVNPAFEGTTGYSKTEAMGQKPSLLKSGKQDASFYTEMWKTLLKGELWNGRLYNRCKNGTLILQEANVAPIRNGDGAVVGFVSVKRDITEHERIKQQLIQSQKMEAVGTLAGGIAHDFNNILSGIIGYTELALSQKLPNDHPVSKYLQEVLGASNRAADLVKQILTLSRSQESSPEIINAKQVAKEVMKLIKASLPPSVHLELIIYATNTHVKAGSTNIHQVLLNLVTNATQSLTEEKGRISICLSNRFFGTLREPTTQLLESGEYLEISVADSGCGMTDDTLKQIFNPYFTTKEAGKGTGLGLSVIHGIVKNLGGHVDVDSKVGKGTTFRVLLPITIKKDEFHGLDSIELPTGKESILLVDDEPFLIQIGEQKLKKLGYKVHAFDDCQAALEAYREDPYAFDLVLTDMSMPGLNGMELSREVRKLRPDVPIIICSGNPTKIDKDEIAGLGIQRVCTKPIAHQEMATMIREVL